MHNIIRDLRQKRNMTLGQLARKTHLTTSYLSKLEKNKYVPAVDKAIRIADALEIHDVRDLFDFNGDATQP